MKVKSFATTLGAGMLAGAAVMMMIPKRSEAYRAADHAAASIRKKMCHAMDSMMD